MTIDSSTLRLLIELAQQRRDTAAAGNAAASAQRERAATTLQMLTDYRSEVREQSPASQGRVASRAQLQVLDRFAQRLDVAIDAQHRQHELQQAAAAQAAAELAARQRRLKALELLEQRQAQARARAAARREQRQHDEYANNAHRRKTR